MSFDLKSPAVMVVPPSGPLRGRVAPPGSKSITNRALLLAGLARGTSRLTGALKSDDTRLMAEALRAMGVRVEEPGDTDFVVTGDGTLKAPAEPLFLGNAGTATRFLTAAVAAVHGTVVVDGDAHMRKRPIRPLVEALQGLGLDVEAPTGCPPVTVRGRGRVPAGRVSIDAGLSSQYVSALLMMAALGEGDDRSGARGRRHRRSRLRRSDAEPPCAVSAPMWSRATPPPGRCARPATAPTDFHVEPDASAATYLWAAEALTGGAIDLGVAADASPSPTRAPRP